MIVPLGRVHMVVKGASTVTSVAEYVAIVCMDVTETRGSVREQKTDQSSKVPNVYLLQKLNQYTKH